MIKWKSYLLLSLIIILTGSGKAFASFQSVSVASFTACVAFTGNPVINHIGLTQLSQGNYAVISGTATCGIASSTITSITVNYYVSGQTGFSTAAVITQGLFKQYFSTAIIVNMANNPASFFYKITVMDNTGRSALWPTAGTFYSFNIGISSAVLSTLQIIHTPVNYISAVDGIMIATGTVSDTVSVNSITMCYKTDDSVVYSSFTIAPYAVAQAGRAKTAAAPMTSRSALNTMNKVNSSTYGFEFALDKNRVNFTKSKYLYYQLVATDINNTVSYLPSQGGYFTVQVISANTITFGSNGGIVSLPNGDSADGQTTIQLPQGALDSNTNITITEIDPADSSVPPGKSPCGSAVPVAVYTFGPEHIVFKKAGTMKLYYQDVDHDGIVDGTNYKASSLQVFWWDGFDWRLLGGKKDPNLNLITYSDVQHFSMYALFPVGSMSDNDYRPKERIITPATVDNKNDFAQFSGLVSGDIVNVYNIRGRKIRQLNQDFSWDGKDDSGKLVESGIYIYQIKLNATGKIINGTIVVAK